MSIDEGEMMCPAYRMTAWDHCTDCHIEDLRRLGEGIEEFLAVTKMKKKGTLYGNVELDLSERIVTRMLSQGERWS